MPGHLARFQGFDVLLYLSCQAAQLPQQRSKSTGGQGERGVLATIRGRSRMTTDPRIPTSSAGTEPGRRGEGNQPGAAVQFDLIIFHLRARTNEET